MEKNWLNLIKKDFHIERGRIPLEEKKQHLMNLLKKGHLHLKILKKELILIIRFIVTKLKEEVQKVLEIVKIR